MVILQTMAGKKSKQILSCIRSIAIAICVIFTCVGCGNQKYVRITVPEIQPPITKEIKDVKVALVLSSGGFRGMAHIGVLEVLEENNIKVDMIVGSSAGSFVGAFYADDPNVTTLKQKLMYAHYDDLVDTSWLNTIKAPFYPTGPVQGRKLVTFMHNNLQAKDFEDLKIPLVIVTTSLVNNQMVVLRSGPIIPAVHASTALPPYFAPVRVYDNQFVDGAVIAPVPVRVAKEFNPKLIIAVDISKRPSLAEPNNAFQITGRALDISFYELANRQANEADIVIRPDIMGYGPFEDDYLEEFYEAGRRAAQEKLPEIKAALLKIKN